MADNGQSRRVSAGHGGGALYPWQIPPSGWKDIFRRIGREIFRDHVFLASAGVAFLAILALFPVLYALFSIYGLVTSPQELHQQVNALGQAISPEAAKMLGSNLRGLTQHSGFALSVSIVLSIAAALWVSVRGVLGIISALNIVNDESERRSWPVLIGTATALAVGALLFWFVSLFLLIAAPFALSHLSSGVPLIGVAIHVARWLLIAGCVLISMAVLYRFGPSHEQPRWQWLGVGSIIATLLWLAGSFGLSYYVAHLGGFKSVYGSLGILLAGQIWFFWTALAFLLGAEFNIEIERQTKPDTTD
ncbi:MAG: YihY/virulence factor BrkB family protein [Gammaproteobacteria bacterium]